MDFSIEPFRRDAFSSGTTPGRTPAEYADEVNFRNELAALQIDKPDAEENSGDGSGLPLSSYAPYDLLWSKPKMASPLAAPTEPESTPEVGNAQSIEIPDTLAAANNNPGNLRFANQTGATPGTGGFARFNSPEDGFQALLHQVRLDAGRGYTLAQYIGKYAPASENDTPLYIQQASQALGLAPNAPLAGVDPAKVAIFQARKESATIVPE